MRLSAITIACMALALLVSLLPAAGAVPRGDSVSRSPARLATGTGAWSPSDLEVDWAAFAREHEAEYRSSSYAAAAAAVATDPEQLRAAMLDGYAAATGTDLPPEYQVLQPARTSALSSQYYDECDDGTNLPDGGRQATREQLIRGGANGLSVTYQPDPPAPPPAIDLRSMFIVQSTDNNGRFDQTGFLVYACREWAFNDLGIGGITFGLYTTFEDGEDEYPTILGDQESGPDFLVSIFPEINVPSRPYQIMAIRTPSRDRSTWTMTFLDRAQRLDGFEIDGVVPTSAIGDFTADSGFAWTVEAVDTKQPRGGRDWFPERNYLLREGEGDEEVAGVHIPQFPVPETCGVSAEAGEYSLQPQAVRPNDAGYPVQWYMPRIDADDAWDTIRDSSTGGRSRPVTVALVDTGIDSTRHDFLEPVRVVAGLDAVYGLELEGGDNGGAIGPILGPQGVAYEAFGGAAIPRNSDRGPHGTAVASLMGARGNNGGGIAGVDWGVRLMPIRVNDVNNCISSTVVSEGIKWAVDHGADIVHISLAAPEIPGGTEGGERQTECNDGVDNDGDGLVDGDDVGCVDEQDGSEGPAPGVDISPQVPACADERDNDGDGRIDTSDPDCDSLSDNDEADRVTISVPPEPLECADGVDNDGDGFIDATDEGGIPADPGCESIDDGSEGPLPGSLLPETIEACQDGRDNNDDDAAADSADPDCLNPNDNNEGREAEEREVDLLREVIDYGLEQGVAVVASSGNFATDGDPVVYPAAYPGVITVGATNRSGARAFYSSTGRWLDTVAPGGNNSGTLSQDLAVLWELDRIRPAAGTSFSAPLVTGSLSLYLGLNPHIARGFEPAPVPPAPGTNYPDFGYQRTVDDLRVAVQNASRDVTPTGHDIWTGWGRFSTDRLLDVPAIGGPLVDPARAQLPRTNADSVVEATEDIALSRPLLIPDFVVFARSDVAVDALAGAPLLAGGPLLVASQDGVSATTMSTLREVLPNGGRVYVLGGDAALPATVDEQLRAAGYEVVRLAGASRFETARAVAEEVRRLWPGSTTVAVARADGGDNPTAQWADALSGGAWAAATRTPILLSPTGQAHPTLTSSLAEWGTTDTIVFGGTSAIADSVLAHLPGSRRVAGADRAATAAAVAAQLWGDTDGYLLANGYFARGWPAAMAAAGLAADTNRPLLYTGAASVPPATAAVLSDACPDLQSLQIIGGASLVGGTAETLLMEAAGC